MLTHKSNVIVKKTHSFLPTPFLSPPLQGSFLIYPESEAASFSEPQISRGIPQNRPIKLLVRVYVVKVSVLSPWLIPMATEVGQAPSGYLFPV